MRIIQTINAKVDGFLFSPFSDVHAIVPHPISGTVSDPTCVKLVIVAVESGLHGVAGTNTGAAKEPVANSSEAEI